VHTYIIKFILLFRLSLLPSEFLLKIKKFQTFFSLSVLDVPDAERETLRQHVKIVAIDLCAACHCEREACNKPGAHRPD